MTHARANAVRWGALAVGIVLFAAALYYINISMAVGTIRRLGVALPLALLAIAVGVTAHLLTRPTYRPG